MGDQVAADAFGRLRRSWAEHFLVFLVLVVLLTVLGASCSALLWRLSQGPRPDAPAVVGVFSTGVLAWSIATTFQRAVLVALGAGDSARTLGEAIREAALRARPLVVLGGCVAVYGLVVAAVGLLAYGVLVASNGRDSTDPFVAGLAFCAWCFVGWLMTRPFLGIATANVVLGGDGVLAAVRSSDRHLVAHRGATLSTRRTLAVPAAAASALIAHAMTTPGASPSWWLATLVLLPVVVSLDAVVEAAWYDRVRARVDVQDIAAVFR